MKTERTTFTRASFLLFLYNIPYSYVGKVFNRDERQFKSILDGKDSRITIQIIAELSSFLGVSTEVILGDKVNCPLFKVYITNIQKWIDYDDYIFLTLTDVITNSLKETKVVHNVNYALIPDKKRKNDIDYLIEVAKRENIVSPNSMRLFSRDTYILKTDKYMNLIYPYLSKYLSDEEINKKTKSERLKKSLETIIYEYQKALNGKK